VEAELRQHGIGRDVVEQLRDELAAPEMEAHSAGEPSEVDGERPDDVPATEEARAKIALAQHLRGRPLPEDRRALQRVGMFLVRRGFDPNAVRSALGAAAATHAESEE